MFQNDNLQVPGKQIADLRKITFIFHKMFLVVPSKLMQIQRKK